MLLTEYDEEKHMRDTYKEGYEEGEQAGYSKGEQAGYSKGEQAGYSRGEQAGYSKGEQAGYSKGEQDGYNKGEQAGYNKGRNALLEEQVKKKLKRGKNVEEIAKELEEDIGTIEDIVKSF